MTFLHDIADGFRSFIGTEQVGWGFILSHWYVYSTEIVLVGILMFVLYKKILKREE